MSNLPKASHTLDPKCYTTASSTDPELPVLVRQGEVSGQEGQALGAHGLRDKLSYR